MTSEPQCGVVLGDGQYPACDWDATCQVHGLPANARLSDADAPTCWCEYVDIGVGEQKVAENPYCPVCNPPCPNCGVGGDDCFCPPFKACIGCGEPDDGHGTSCVQGPG